MACGQVGAFQQHGEFLAAKPADERILLRRQLRHAANGRVADVVPISIIDLLEMIDIDHDGGQRGAGPGAGADLLRVSKKARRLQTPVSGSVVASRISSLCIEVSRSAARNRA